MSGISRFIKVDSDLSVEATDRSSYCFNSQIVIHTKVSHVNLVTSFLFDQNGVHDTEGISLLVHARSKRANSFMERFHVPEHQELHYGVVQGTY